MSEAQPMRFAYADPPYLGYAKAFYGDLHADAVAYDKPEAHQALIDRLCSDYDGWMLSLTSGNLFDILPMCPRDCRIGAWVKPFASFKPGVGVAYAWEPVIFRGGRKRQRVENTTRDWCSANITLMRGFTGAKPEGFVRWFLEVMNANRADTVDDVFYGSGAVSNAIEQWRREPDLMSLQPIRSEQEAML